MCIYNYEHICITISTYVLLCTYMYYCEHYIYRVLVNKRVICFRPIFPFHMAAFHSCWCSFLKAHPTHYVCIVFANTCRVYWSCRHKHTCVVHWSYRHKHTCIVHKIYSYTYARTLPTEQYTSVIHQHTYSMNVYCLLNIYKLMYIYTVVCLRVHTYSICASRFEFIKMKIPYRFMNKNTNALAPICSFITLLLTTVLFNNGKMNN